MAGKRGRGKKVDSIAVEAADSTSAEEQSQQNGNNEIVEPIKVATNAKKGGKAKKEIAEKIIEEKPVKHVATKKAGRGKNEEPNGNIEELNGEIEPKGDLEITSRKGKSKKELNGNATEKVKETTAVAKKGRGKKAATVEPPQLNKEERIVEESEVNDTKKKTSISPVKKSGRKRAAETHIVDNKSIEDDSEITDTKKQKKEKDGKLKELSTEKESSKILPSKSGRGKKIKESIETEAPAEPIPPTQRAAEKSAKGGRGKKRINTEEVVNDVQDLNAEEKVVEPVIKKGKKSKATAKTDLEKSTKKKLVAEKKIKINATETFYDIKDFELDKEYTLKISSWNVAGLRSWITKGGLKYIQYEKPDIFCLQEIKCSEDMIPDEARIKGYHPYWCCKPGGYAGVAIYSKKMPINVEYGIGDEEQDADGRILTAEYEKFYLVNVYVPNAGRKLVTLPKRMRWDNLFHDYVIKLNKKKPVIICGDMNVSHQEIDLANPKTNKKNAGFTQEERDGMTKLLSLGFVDSFRHLYPDKVKAYTFWTYMMNARAKNVGWRLDYFILSEKLINKVTESTIRSQVMGSDHCPITLFLNN